MIDWWTVEQATWIGAIGGSAIGVVGGTLGAAVGVLAPRGVGRRVVIPLMVTLTLGGGVALVAGIVALILGQPYHVYYPLLLGGGVTGGVMGALIPTVRAAYRRAEQNRLGAEELRRG